MNLFVWGVFVGIFVCYAVMAWFLDQAMKQVRELDARNARLGEEIRHGQ